MILNLCTENLCSAEITTKFEQVLNPVMLCQSKASTRKFDQQIIIFTKI